MSDGVPIMTMEVIPPLKAIPVSTMETHFYPREEAWHVLDGLGCPCRPSPTNGGAVIVHYRQRPAWRARASRLLSRVTEYLHAVDR